MTKPIPEGYHTITPSLMFKNTRQAIDFYKRALGARERDVFTGPDGKSIMHAEIWIGDSILMMGDEDPKYKMKSAESVGQATGAFTLYVEDADASFKRAVDAGAKVEMPMAEMFWGDRMGSVIDPFGYAWHFMTHVRDVSKEDVNKAIEQMRKEEPMPAAR
jgi:PhnB protein